MKAVELAFKFGIDHHSATAFIGWATINCSVLEKFDEGYKHGKAALKMQELFEDDSRLALQLFVWANFIQHWKEPLRNTLPVMLESHKVACKTGSVFILVYSGAHYCYHSFFAGDNLTALVPEFEKYQAVVENRGHYGAISTIGVYYQTVLNLTGASAEPCRLVGSACDETVMIPRFVANKESVSLYDLFQCKMVLALLFGRYEEAYLAALEVEKYSSAVVGTYSIGVRPFYDSVVCLKLREETAGQKKSQLLKRVSTNQQKLKKYAKASPANYLHKYNLVGALLASCKNKTERAGALFDEAIQGAIENRFTNDAALASELAALHFSALCDGDLSRSHAKRALSHYQEWGAGAKAEHVKKVFGL